MKKIFILCVLTLIVLATVQAKEYGLDKVRLYYQISHDGSINVTCDLSYWFSGSFTAAWITIPRRELTVLNPGVSELEGEREINYRFQKETPEATPQTFDFTHDGQEYRITWFFRANNTRKTFRLRYQLSETIKVYDDVAEFYLKVWGADWPVQVPALWVEVAMPAAIAARGDVAYWMHPRIEGQIGIDKDFKKIIAYAGNIRPRQWVEVRIVFPRGYLSALNPSKVISLAGSGREKILSQERSWQEKEVKRILLSKKLSVLSLPAAASLLFLGILFALRIYLRYGREPKVLYENEYEREVPSEVSPAQADMILSQGKTVSSRGIIASTLELARRGFIKIEEVEREGFLGSKKKDFKVVVIERPEKEGLSPELKLFLDQWRQSAGKKGFLISELKKKDLSSFKSSFDRTVLRRVYGKNGWIVRQGEKVLTWWTVAWGATMVTAIFLLILLRFLPDHIQILWLPLALFLNVTISLLFRKAVRQYTPAGKLLALRLAGLKKFLKDFSLISEHPPTSLAIWESYLVFGAVLGVTKEVLKAMKELRVPIESLSWFSPSISAGMGDLGSAFESFNSSLTSFSQAFASAVASSTASSSSSGGGGGAGGGGGGAR
ncbi:MAG: DUF2207 family protein [Candidatus Aminicenantales bacterium]